MVFSQYYHSIFCNCWLHMNHIEYLTFPESFFSYSTVWLLQEYLEDANCVSFEVSITRITVTLVLKCFINAGLKKKLFFYKWYNNKCRSAKIWYKWLTKWVWLETWSSSSEAVSMDSIRDRKRRISHCCWGGIPLWGEISRILCSLASVTERLYNAVIENGDYVRP